MNSGKEAKIIEGLKAGIQKRIDNSEGVIKKRETYDDAIKRHEKTKQIYTENLEKLAALTKNNDDMAKLFVEGPPESLASLSKQTATQMHEIAVLKDLITRFEKEVLPALETQLTESKHALSEEVYMVFCDEMQKHLDTVNSIVHDELEPLLTSWPKVVASLAGKNNMSYTRLSFIRRICFKSEIVDDAVEGTFPKLIQCFQ